MNLSKNVLHTTNPFIYSLTRPLEEIFRESEFNSSTITHQERDDRLAKLQT